MSDRTWLVMSAQELPKNNGRSFDSNAVGLTQVEAEAEAVRRNAVEKAAGHKGITWFPAEDPMAALARMMKR